MTRTVVLRDLRSQKDHVLKPETQVLLRSAGAHNWQGGWLEHMRLLLGDAAE